MALAVIFLAIKEPRCNCDQEAASAETPTPPQSSVPVRSRTQIQRELGKFWSQTHSQFGAGDLCQRRWWSVRIHCEYISPTTHHLWSSNVLLHEVRLHGQSEKTLFDHQTKEILTKGEDWSTSPRACCLVFTPWRDPPHEQIMPEESRQTGALVSVHWPTNSLLRLWAKKARSPSLLMP